MPRHGHKNSLLLELMGSPAFAGDRFVSLVTERQSLLLLGQADCREVIDKERLLEFIGNRELPFLLGRSGRLFTLFWVGMALVYTFAHFADGGGRSLWALLFVLGLFVPIIAIGASAWRNDNRVIYVNREGIGERKAGSFIRWCEAMDVRWNWVHFSLLVYSSCDSSHLRIPRDIPDFQFLHTVLRTMVPECPVCRLGASYRKRKLTINI